MDETQNGDYINKNDLSVSEMLWFSIPIFFKNSSFVICEGQNEKDWLG